MRNLADRGIHLVAVNPLCQAHHSVMELIGDAATDLEMRGYLDPEEEEIPPHVVALLLELYLAGACGLRPGWPSPATLADHALYRWQTEAEQGLPIWTCDCGAAYKLLAPWGNQEEFYQVGEDGCLGDPVGGIKRNSKGQVKHSDACPGCGRGFAGVIADRANPQQALF
jgi:hypothetical protein